MAASPAPPAHPTCLRLAPLPRSAGRIDRTGARHRRSDGSTGAASAPSAACARSVAARSRVCRRSRPSNGSSIISTGCGVSRPTASTARLRSPFDSVPMVASRNRPSDRAVRQPLLAAAPARRNNRGQSRAPSRPFATATARSRREDRRGERRAPAIRRHDQPRGRSHHRPAAHRRRIQTATSCPIRSVR